MAHFALDWRLKDVLLEQLLSLRIQPLHYILISSFLFIKLFFHFCDRFLSLLQLLPDLVDFLLKSGDLLLVLH